MYATRYLIYLFQLMLYFFYSVLRFVTKPGSRLLVPIAAAAILFLGHDFWEAALTAIAQQFDAGLVPDGTTLDILLGIGWVVFSIVYAIASRMLALIFGAFPVALRPMPPTRSLKAPEKMPTERAVARIIVPALPKR